MKKHRTVVLAVLLLLLALALPWPAYWNGGPFYTVDSRTYLRGADAAQARLTHRPTAWTAGASVDEPKDAHVAALALHNLSEARSRTLDEIKEKGVILGRSPYYGILLLMGWIAGGFWLTLFLQAASLLLVAWLLLRAWSVPAWPYLPLAGLVLLVVPATPFFVSFLMPDLFAGIAVLACAVLLSPARLARLDRAAWLVLLMLSALFHDSCALLILSLLVLHLAWSLVRRRAPSRRGVCTLTLACAVAFAGQALVSAGIARATGRPALRLPFVSARLIEDGPGTRYLQASCPASGFALCGYVRDFPMADADFLFGTESGHSVFEMAPYATRLALSREQGRFLLAVLRYDPWGVARSGIRNAARQFVDFRLLAFEYDAGMRATVDRTFPLAASSTVQASSAYRGTLPMEAVSAFLYLMVAASLAILVWPMGKGRRKSGDSAGGSMVAWTLAGIALNAAICGAVSAVDPRYQARVIWTLPLLALAAVAQRRLAER